MADTRTKLFVEALGKNSLSRRFRSAATTVRYYHFSCTRAPNFPNFSPAPAHSVFYNWILIRARRLIFLARVLRLLPANRTHRRDQPHPPNPPVPDRYLPILLYLRYPGASRAVPRNVIIKVCEHERLRGLNMSCLVNAHEYNYDISSG